MRSVIQNFVEDKSTQNGLLLIDMPTGAGKTYQVIHYIKDLMKDRPDKKIYFVTTLKKNLDSPFEDLLEILSTKDEKDAIFRIKSNVDFIKDNLSKELLNEIENNNRKIFNSTEFKSLREKLELARILEDQNIESTYTDFQDAERTFRKFLSKILHEQFKEKDKKLLAIKKNKEWQWVGKLYPSIFTQEKKVLFLTMEKFLYPYSTIIEPAYFFYNHKSFKNSIVFIDEFDATKETMLSHIIKENINDCVNYINLFKNLYAGLITSQFPKKLLTPSEYRKQGVDGQKSIPLETILQKRIEVAKKINEKHNLDFCHKSQGFKREEQYFLFNDFGYLSMVTDKKDISTKYDESNNWNAIILESIPDAEKIQDILRDIRNFVSYFIKGISALAINYQHLRQDEINKSEIHRDYTNESAIQTVLSALHLEPKYSMMLSNMVQMSWRNKKDIEGEDFDEDYEDGDISFCNKGWCFYEFIDEDWHDVKTDIVRYSFEVTPEQILKKLCLVSKVIGISATATLKTVIGNYDLNYLKWRLHGGFREITKEERTTLSNQFKKSVEKYNDVNIKVVTSENMTDDDYLENNQWDKIFTKKELSKSIYDKLEQKLPPKVNEKGQRTDVYLKRRYYRIAWAFKQFIENDDIHSFLCLLTALPNDKPYFNWDLLKDILYSISNEHDTNYDTDCIVLLKTDKFEESKKHIQSDLANGKKRFVISTYPTIGAGQNLQYDIPEKLKDKIVHTNNFTKRHQKDFDAIYLDKPTNVVVNIRTDELSTEDMVKYIYQCEYLKDNREISDFDKVSHIRTAFDKKRGKKSYIPSLLEKTSVKISATRCLIQAIGRICRTNMKNKNIYIFAHDEIKDIIYTPITSDEQRDFNLEFKELVKALSIKKQDSVEIQDIRKLAEEYSNRTNKQIQRFLKESFPSHWTNERINQWCRLRDYVLQHPTINKAEWSVSPWKYFYVALDSNRNYLYYKKEKDFGKTYISFRAKKGYETENMSTTNLYWLLQIRGLKDFFIKENYAIEWKNNSYIMSPPLYNNIYKGALGEIVGRHYFENILGLKLEELEASIYECFDFKIVGKSIYVDFKFWQESSQFNSDDYRKHIKSKMEKCHADNVIIVNTQFLQEQNYNTIVNDGIIEIPYIYTIMDGRLKPNLEAYNIIKETVYGKFSI